MTLKYRMIIEWSEEDNLCYQTPTQTEQDIQMQFQDNLSFMMGKAKGTSQKPVRLEDTIPETNLVAMIHQEFAEIDRLKDLKFYNGFDDLDYLTFTTLSLPSGNRVGLVRHKNSPAPGIEICVSYNHSNIAEVLKEALREMNLTILDLTWIHPEYKNSL